MATKKDKENLLYKFNNEINEKMHIFFTDLGEGCKSYAHMNDDMNNLYNIFIKSKEIISMLEVNNEPIEEAPAQEDEPIESKTIDYTNSSVDILELSHNTCDTLKGHGICTIGTLLNFQGERLLRLNNIGKKKVYWIKNRLSDFGLKLREELIDG